jgi:hypothetical protein
MLLNSIMIIIFKKLIKTKKSNLMMILKLKIMMHMKSNMKVKYLQKENLIMNQVREIYIV